MSAVGEAAGNGGEAATNFVSWNFAFQVFGNN